MKRLTGLLLLLLWDPLLADNREANIREQCRVDASSFLINLHNRAQISQTSISSWEDKLKKIAQERSKATAELKKLEKDATGTFDRLIEERITGKKNKILVFNTEMMQGKALIKKEREVLQDTKRRLKIYEKSAVAVFVVDVLPVSLSKTPSYRLRYKHTCGQFEVVCSLPKEHREKLLQIAEAMGGSTPCRRYAQVLPVISDH